MSFNKVRQLQVSGTKASNHSMVRTLGVEMKETESIQEDLNNIRSVLNDLKGDNWYTAVTSGSDISALAGHLSGAPTHLQVKTDIDVTGSLYLSGDIDLAADGSIGRIDLDVDNDTSIRSPADDVIMFEVGGSDKLVLSASNLAPGSGNDGLALGTTVKSWSDLFLANGGVVNFNAGDVTLTHSSNVLTVAGGGFRMSGTGQAQFGGSNEYLTKNAAGNLEAVAAASIVLNTDASVQLDSATNHIGVTGSLVPNADAARDLGTSAIGWNDLHLGAGGIVNFDGGDVTMTHSSGAVTVSGGTFTVGDFSATGSIDLGSALTDTVTIAGDLIIKGTTTTVSSSNMIVKDPIIALGIASSSAGGSYTLGAAGDRGLAFPMAGAYAGSPVMFWDHTSIVAGRPQGTFKLAFATTSASGSESSITPSALANLAVSKLFITGTSNYLEAGSNLKIVNQGDLLLGPGGGNVCPLASNGAALGASDNMWADLFLASGGVVNFNNGNATITHSSALLTTNVAFRAARYEIDGATNYIDVLDSNIAMNAAADIVLHASGGDVKIGGNLIPNTDDGGALGASGTEWSDLFLNGGGVINWDNGNATITHNAGVLTLAGSEFRLGVDKKLQFATANDYIFLGGGNLNVTASADINLNPGGNDVNVDGNVIPLTNATRDLGSAAMGWRNGYFSDLSKLQFGNDQDIGLIHRPDTGLHLTGSHANGTTFAIDNTTADGDVRVAFELSGITKFSLGVEDGDNDKFVINRGVGALGADPVFEIDSSGHSTFVDGAFNVDIASHDGINGLHLGGVLVTATAAQINAGGARYKTTYAVTASHTLNKEVVVSGLNTTKGRSDANVLDVYLNGQLMMSGTSIANGDYLVHALTATTNIKFFFALETGDQIACIESTTR